MRIWQKPTSYGGGEVVNTGGCKGSTQVGARWSTQCVANRHDTGHAHSAGHVHLEELQLDKFVERGAVADHAKERDNDVGCAVSTVIQCL